EGPGTGTSPLPTMLAFFAGAPASGKPNPNDRNSYLATAAGGANWANATFVNALAINGPAPGTFTNNFINTAGFRNNGVAAGLPVNFFLLNPGKLGGAFTVENNGRSYYDAAVVEIRRRMSHGLLLQGSYTFARNLTNMPVSSAVVFYQPPSLREVA